MKYIKVPETALERLIEGLESAVNVCYTAPNNPGIAMQQVIKDLQSLKTQAK
jgi:hypothetical protein